jgi:hypothetical protein
MVLLVFATQIHAAHVFKLEKFNALEIEECPAVGF